MHLSVVLVCALCWCTACVLVCERPPSKAPTVVVAVLLRNKQHTLPYFFGCLNALNYPKNRITLWFASDHNEDNSTQVLRAWMHAHAHHYHRIVVHTNDTDDKYPDQRDYKYWSPLHYRHVIELRQEALEYARHTWADYILMMDADVFLTEPNALEHLIAKGLPLVAPMLISDRMYSNFWCAMTPEYYYARNDDYEPIQSRRRQGCFAVPMIHTAVLMDLRAKSSDLLAYEPNKMMLYNGPDDDIIAFAVNANTYGCKMHVCNDHLYGFVSEPMDGEGTPARDANKLLNIRVEAIGRGVLITADAQLAPPLPKLNRYNCDTIFMINLPRRHSRRELMQHTFHMLHMDVDIYPAVDGALLNTSELGDGIKLMAEYRDPYHDRAMKAGEVGCFLSHYNIWKNIVTGDMEMVMVLEDDIHFMPNFKDKYYSLLAELKHLQWDLVYLGRKVLMSEAEERVTSRIVKPKYSYWTLGYLITKQGAKKLIEAKPLEKLLPVDEFLPIMYNEHPNITWKEQFEPRDLLAYSASPLLMYPTHYTGEPGYVSDTEDSHIIGAPHQ